jgi:hypothetical protein
MKATKFSQFLQHREELQFVDRPHWIYIVEAGIWTTLIILIGFWVHSWIADNLIYPGITGEESFNSLLLTAAGYGALIAKWGSLLYGTLYFLSKVIFYFSTFVFASDRRLYFKTGMVRVQVFEISFDEIRKTDINYGWLGRFLGYGKLMLDARFVEDEDLPYTHKPETFGKLIHYNNDLAQDINLSMATNEIRKGRQREDKIITAAEGHEDVDRMHDQMDAVHYKYPTERDAVERTEKKRKTQMDDKIHHDFDNATDTISDDDDQKRPAKTGFLKT